MAKYEALRPSGARALLVLGISDVVALEDEAAVKVEVKHVSAWGRWARDVAVPVDAADVIAELGRHFDIVWASEWGHNAHTAFGEALGLPAEPWPFLPVQFDKLAAIRNYARGLPWVWIDGDVVDLHPQDPEDGEGIILRVDPGVGISGLDVGALVAAVEDLAASADAP
ncbi:MAG: hypothetical protein LBE25_09665 [Arthrobacter sp.]|jgi:hypothetical protein|nr:hypothetical protein [Arthrobacter sp.]